MSAAWRQVVATLRDDDKTPLVHLLLQVIEEQSQGLEEQAQRIAALEAEIVRLKGGPKKPASNSKPSAFSKPAVARAPLARARLGETLQDQGTAHSRGDSGAAEGAADRFDVVAA